MSSTPSDNRTLQPWPPPPMNRDPAEQQAWALQWQGKLLKGLPDESQRVDLIHYAISNIDLFRSTSQVAWERDLRLFINIHFQRDHKNPAKWLGVNGEWVKSWQEIRRLEEETSGTLARSGDYAEAMDHWLVFIQEKKNSQLASKEAKTGKDRAADYREKQKMVFAENTCLRRKDRRSPTPREESDDGSDGRSDREVTWSVTPEPGRRRKIDNHDDEMVLDELDGDNTSQEVFASQSTSQIPSTSRSTSSRSSQPSRSQSRGRSRTPIIRSHQVSQTALMVERMTDKWEPYLKQIATSAEIPATSEVTQIKESINAMQKKQDEMNSKIEKLAEMDSKIEKLTELLLAERRRN